MHPPGNMLGVYRPQRVGSSTCPKPKMAQDGAVLGIGDVEIDYNDFPHALDGRSQFMLNHALENGITDGSGVSYY